MPNIKTYRQLQWEKKIEDKATKTMYILIVVLFSLSLLGNIYLIKKNQYLENTITEMEIESQPDYNGFQD